MPSKLQTQIGNAIRVRFHGSRIIQNSRPDWLIVGSQRLELDFYLPYLCLAFEVQGQQHFRKIKRFHKDDAAFKAQLARDKAKRELCEKRGVRLYEVSTLKEFEALIRG